MAKPFTNSVLLTLYGLKEAARGGLSPERLLDAAGISPEELRDPDARILTSRHINILTEAARMSGNELFWLSHLQKEDVSRDNLSWYYYYNARTLREASSRAENSYRLTTDVAYPTHHLHGDEFTVRMTARDKYELNLYQVDWGLSHWHDMLLLFAGPALKLRSVRLRGAPGVRKGPYEEFFGVPIEFGQAYYGLVFDREAYDLPNIRQDLDPNLDRLLARWIEPALEALHQPQPLVSEVTRIIQTRLPDGPPTLQEVAAELGMSARTLQRRLTALGCSVSSLVRETRRELAVAYLRQPTLNVTDVSLLLGFADTGSFTTAFRGWHGVTPSVFRRQPSKGAGSAPPKKSAPA